MMVITMKKLTPIHKFKKTGFWLATIRKNNTLFVVSAAKTPMKALETAKQEGFLSAALMRSAKHYGSFVPCLR